jgi:hypothetical protein
MTVYTYLSNPVPTIAYCAIHQAASHVTEDDYVKTMKELHQRILHESVAIQEGYRRTLEEIISREGQAVRGSLTEFIQTPLRSDEEEVRGRIGESLRRVTEQLDGSGRLGLIRSLEGKLTFPASRTPHERKILQHGKEYFEGLGFALAKDSSPSFESMFVVQGGLNLDILEHIVRDKLGIYATTHGKHIKEFGNYAYSMYNLVYESGTFPVPGDDQSGLQELAIFFSKPAPEVIKYAPFRSGLSQALDKLMQATKPAQISVWQRKLGLGVGVEFVLRILCTNSEGVGEIIQWLSRYKEKSLIPEVLTEKGRLTVKPILFSF